MRHMMSATPEATTDNALYEQIGNVATADTAIDVFYCKVLSDYRINHFFDEIVMEEQAAKQKAFFTMAFGGPNDYTGEDLRKAHTRLVKMRLNNDQ